MQGSAVRDTRQKGITREAVAAATAAVIADLGVDQLSMRKVAVRLGVTPMALYNHVRDKEELLELAAEHVREQIRVDESAEPRAQLSSLVRQLCDLGAQQPRLLEGVAVARSAGAARLTVSSTTVRTLDCLTPCAFSFPPLRRTRRDTCGWGSAATAAWHDSTTGASRRTPTTAE